MTQRPTVALVGFGTAGDIHPLLALGAPLLAGGQRVVLLANEVFEPLARAAGFGFICVGTAHQQQTTLAHPKLWHPVDGLGVMWRYMLRPALRPSYYALERLHEQGPCVVLASPVAMGARLAQERLGIPLGSLYTAATMLRTTYDPMTLAQWRVPHWFPRILRRAAWQFLDTAKLEPLVRPDLLPFRVHLGLPPIRGSVFGEWMHSPQGGLALFPNWFAPAAPDWPKQVAQTGFPLYDAAVAQAPSAKLVDFIAEGAPPLVFMPGTGRRHVAEFFRAAARACEATGERGVLLGDVPEDLAQTLPPPLYAAEFAPFDWLLPRARALVHHGGVGSSAQALQAGIPQLVVPSAFDQHDNAMRLERLGVARSVASADLEQVTPQLQSLLADPNVPLACERLQSRVGPLDARQGALALVEYLSRQLSA